jgi:integrase
MPKQKRYDSIYWRKDRKQWWVSYTDPTSKNADKRLRRPALGAQNHEEARIFLENKRREVRERQTLKPGEVPPCENTFEEIADKFLAYQKPRLTPKAYIREAGIVAHLKAFFRGPLADITSAHVSDYVTARLGKVGKSSVRKELNSLKHLFRLVCGEWKLLPSFANPCLDVQSPRVHDERTQHLSPDQFRRLLAASPDNVRPIFALLTATGMRRSELLTCQWKYVDSTRILLPTSKNDEPKEIHLNTFAQKVLESIPQGEPEDLLFPDITPEAVSMAFHRVCKLLGFADIRLHDLRHTFATWLRQGGVQLDVIAAQLGHRDLRMTKRYARVASSQVSHAVKGLDKVLPDAVTARTPKSLTAGTQDDGGLPT